MCAEDTKTCLHCGGQATRRPGEEGKDWERRKYCSQRCAAKANSQKRSADLARVAQRKGHPVSEPMSGEPDWVARARELRQMGWTYKRICVEVGQAHGTVHRWVSPDGDATKRNRPDHRSKLLICEECGKKFKTAPSRLAAGRRFCSAKCFHAEGRHSPAGMEAVRQKLRAQRQGRANPGYRHGRYAGKKTKEMEKTFNLRRKGERVCRNCGDDTRQQNAHHAVPRSLSVAGRLDLRNCLPLCNSCHLAWHRGRVITRDRFTAEEWEFVTTLIGQDWLDERYPEPPGSWEFRDPTREKSDEEMARIEAARVEARLTA